jgi:CxxC motif-containing protein
MAYIINLLLTSLARYAVQRNIGPRSFCTGSVSTKNTSVPYFSVQTSRSINKKLINMQLLDDHSIL